jgi:hypothetical protein
MSDLDLKNGSQFYKVALTLPSAGHPSNGGVLRATFLLPDRLQCRHFIPLNHDLFPGMVIRA